MCDESIRKRGRPTVNAPRTLSKSVGRGVVIRSQSREFVCSVREYFEKERDAGAPLVSLDKVVERTISA